MNGNFKAQGYKIGEIAGRVGINVQTLRYYERLRILIPKNRRASGYRIYGQEELKRIRFIKKAQELGFSLKEIEGLLKLKVTTLSQCDAVRRRAEQKINEVEKKMDRLKAMQRILKELIASCHKKETTDRCPMLRSLEEG